MYAELAVTSFELRMTSYGVAKEAKGFVTKDEVVSLAGTQPRRLISA